MSINLKQKYMKSFKSEEDFKILDKNLGTDFFNVLRQFNILVDIYDKKKDSSKVKEYFTNEEIMEIRNEFLSYRYGIFKNRVPFKYKKLSPEKAKKIYLEMKDAIKKMEEICNKLELKNVTNIKSLQDVLNFVKDSNLSEKDKKMTTIFLIEMFKI